MLKIRAMGTVEELEDFRLFMEQDSTYHAESISDIYRNKGTDQYHRMYMDIYRDLEDTENGK